MFNMTETAEPVDLLLDLHKDVQYAQNKKSHFTSNLHGAEGVFFAKSGHTGTINKIAVTYKK